MNNEVLRPVLIPKTGKFIQDKIRDHADHLLRVFFRSYTTEESEEGDTRCPATGDKIRISIEMENLDPKKSLSKITSETFVDLANVRVIK